jgi:hypothetical protein
MASARDDYLQRLITQAAEALRRLRSRLGTGDSVESVRAEADAAIGTLLGPQREMLERLDAWSAINLLGDAARARAWVDLLALQADTRDAQGDSTRADAVRQRVAALGAQLAALPVTPP